MPHKFHAVFFPCVYDVRSILYPLQPSVHQHIVLSVQDVLNIVSSDPVSSLCTFSPSISLLIKFRIRTQDQDLPMLVSRYFCLWLFPTILLIHVIEFWGQGYFLFHRGTTSALRIPGLYDTCSGAPNVFLVVFFKFYIGQLLRVLFKTYQLTPFNRIS